MELKTIFPSENNPKYHQLISLNSPQDFIFYYAYGTSFHIYSPNFSKYINSIFNYKNLEISMINFSRNYLNNISTKDIKLSILISLILEESTNSNIALLIANFSLLIYILKIKSDIDEFIYLLKNPNSHKSSKYYNAIIYLYNNIPNYKLIIKDLTDSLIAYKLSKDNSLLYLPIINLIYILYQIDKDEKMVRLQNLVTSATMKIYEFISLRKDLYKNNFNIIDIIELLTADQKLNNNYQFPNNHIIMRSINENISIKKAIITELNELQNIIMEINNINFTNSQENIILVINKRWVSFGYPLWLLINNQYVGNNELTYNHLEELIGKKIKSKL
jgi:hypothetical protein